MIPLSWGYDFPYLTKRQPFKQIECLILPTHALPWREKIGIISTCLRWKSSHISKAESVIVPFFLLLEIRKELLSGGGVRNVAARNENHDECFTLLHYLYKKTAI